MPAPSTLQSVYCTDEDILVRCNADFAVLAPAWQLLAAGSDGVLVPTGSTSPAGPWTLQSASVDFAANGVNAAVGTSVFTNVVQLTGPAPFKGATGQLFAIDSVNGNEITLRRPNQPLYQGQPPSGSTQLAGVTFAVKTVYPQIDNACYTINEKFGVLDEGSPFSIFWKQPGYMTDVRELRELATLLTLCRLYASEVRVDRGDFALKLKEFQRDYADCEQRTIIRWGPFGQGRPASTKFSMNMMR